MPRGGGSGSPSEPFTKYGRGAGFGSTTFAVTEATGNVTRAQQGQVAHSGGHPESELPS